LHYPFDVGDEPINGPFAKRLISGSDDPFRTGPLTALCPLSAGDRTRWVDATLFWRGQQRTIDFSTWRDTMNKAFIAVGLGLAFSSVAFAQQKSVKEEIVGAWSLVSVTSETDDGSKGEPFGSSPKGVIMFSNDGHFSLFQSRAEITKIAANDRAKATPEEAQSIVASSIAYYGTYSIDEKTKVMLVNLAGSTYANVAAISNQKRTITLLTSDELKFDNARTPNGMTLRTTWKRAATP
jgi:hypothetical protein